MSPFSGEISPLSGKTSPFKGTISPCAPGGSGSSSLYCTAFAEPGRINSTKSTAITQAVARKRLIAGPSLADRKILERREPRRREADLRRGDWRRGKLRPAQSLLSGWEIALPNPGNPGAARVGYDR